MVINYPHTTYIFKQFISIEIFQKTVLKFVFKLAYANTPKISHSHLHIEQKQKVREEPSCTSLREVIVQPSALS